MLEDVCGILPLLGVGCGLDVDGSGIGVRLVVISEVLVLCVGVCMLFLCVRI